MGLGTAQLGDLYLPLDQGTAQAIVDKAWEGGIRHFDTAPHYGLGLSESRLGLALQDRPRDDYVISTKVGRIIEGSGTSARRKWDFSAGGIRASLAASRRRLSLDRIDIALVHDPEGHAEEAITHAVPALEGLRAAGDVGAIGVGSRDVPTLLRFVRECDIDVVMVAGRLTLLDRSALDELVPACIERGVSVLSAGVFNSGVLANDVPDPASHFDYAPPSPSVMRRAQELAAIAARHGFTLPEAAVAFARRPSPPVVSVVMGAETPDQVARNIALLGATGAVDGLSAAV
ncbi:MAG: fdh [Microbacterium sp.]|jgi:D-threo-aldose 1-dehydrogenase|uniref:aldo/keto reductase n=1 Tax=Microbacterium sp. TaxID=51671 RepID=UPI0026395290|nr:aldo/keto reductase [Microbacterium sp.]MDF2559206.1 fdh [Microbacterium sp.]